MGPGVDQAINLTATHDRKVVVNVVGMHGYHLIAKVKMDNDLIAQSAVSTFQ